MLDEPENQLRLEFSQRQFDGQLMKELVKAGLTWLRTNHQLVNSLNVFPVPDGDTGTNMLLTLQAAYDEIKDSPETNIGEIAHLLSNGALMGARGNSGVILSQLLRGFARGLDHYEVMDTNTFVQALSAARDTAYKGVVRPVEGTILTVAKDIALAAETALQNGGTHEIISIMDTIVQAAERSVEHTPELLPVLKEAGVVDAGGKGLYFILEGMIRHIYHLPLDIANSTVKSLAAMQIENAAEMIEPGQDFEVVVDFRPSASLHLPSFYEDLEKMGTSIQVGEGDGFYRMHIHVPTEKRYEPIEYTMKLGTVTKVAIENLTAQVESKQDPCRNYELKLTPIEAGQIAVVAVSPGIGISRVFASLGAAAIVNGGQTMNPSTQEIVHAFEDLPTDKIIILPNNKNIIMAARMAADVSVKKVAVIPSVSIPQGLSAILRLAPDGDFDEVVEEMKSALNDVQTGEITTATRNVEIDGVQVSEGQIIALHNGKLVAAASTLEEACLCMLEKAQAAQHELITLFHGNNINKAEVNRICELIRENYPNQEIELQEGCQPHYQFIVSIE
jgi:hypothetical protein